MWKEKQLTEARCDIAPNKVCISYRNPEFGIISLWKKSLYGRTLTDIKEDPEKDTFFASGMSKLIRQILGHSLQNRDWCIVTSPKRWHKVLCFSYLYWAFKASQYSFLWGCGWVPFKTSCRRCFTFDLHPPKENNIIVFHDFVTTGATMTSMRNLLVPLGKNMVFITAINNKLWMLCV